MFKIFLRTLIILLTAGLVAGGIYMFTQYGGMNLIGAAQDDGFSQQRGLHAQPADGEASQRQHLKRGREGQMGLSFLGLSGVVVQAGKIAVITALVMLVKRVVSMFGHRRKPANTVLT